VSGCRWSVDLGVALTKFAARVEHDRSVRR
jgi:hypothetical protein